MTGWGWGYYSQHYSMDTFSSMAVGGVFLRYLLFSYGLLKVFITI